jgi:hypothetical protein
MNGNTVTASMIAITKRLFGTDEPRIPKKEKLTSEFLEGNLGIFVKFYGTLLGYRPRGGSAI